MILLQKRTRYWVFILWISDLIYLNSNLMMFEEKGKRMFWGKAAVNDSYPTHNITTHTNGTTVSDNELLIKSCRAICSKLEKLLADNDGLEKLSIRGMYE